MKGFPAWVEPGVSYSRYGHRYHVRGFVDDQVILREWWPTKQRWNYTVESPSLFRYSENECVKRKLRGALLKEQP